MRSLFGIMSGMKPIATDTSVFEEFYSRNVVYVDKTDILHKLITSVESKLYFVSRPRRFGKSLMISTLDCIFRGKRELFKGLKIDSLDYDWQTYPIIRFDFSQVTTGTLENFQKDFVAVVKRALEVAGATYDCDLTPGANFASAICELSQKYGKNVVILVDEYDAPIGHALGEIEKAEAIRNELSSLYIQIKANIANIRFMMMTGVTKFTQLSVFSALNNLTDLTLAPAAASLLGYTEEELTEYFTDHMKAHAQVMGLPYEDYRAQLKYWYNGYRFSRRTPTTVYNPIAIAQTLSMQEPSFIPTWSKTGRPSVLMNYLGSKPTLLENYECLKGQFDTVFDAASLDALQPVTMFYQGGYLTIKDFDGMYYTLGVPNEEIRRDLNTLLVEVATKEKASQNLYPTGFNLHEHDFAKVEAHLKALYARLPYGSKEDSFRKAEASYVRVLTAVLMASGYIIRPEDQQSHGRSDLVAEGKTGIFIFEFKVDKSAAEALVQIEEKDYAAPYMADTRPIFAFGLNFSSETSLLTDFTVKQLKP